MSLSLNQKLEMVKLGEEAMWKPCGKPSQGTSLVAQWVGLRTPNAGGRASIPGHRTRSHMHAATKSLHATTKEPV